MKNPEHAGRRGARRDERGEQGNDGDPGRRFAYEQAFDPRFEGRRWADVESELRSEYAAWVERHGVGEAHPRSWEDVKDSVREAWESALDIEHTQLDPRSGQWDEQAPRYRQMWETQYGTAAGRWEDVEPGYRYAHEMAFDPRYQGRPWGDVAPFLESGLPTWAATHGYQVREGNGLWERLRDSIRHAWERITHR